MTRRIWIVAGVIGGLLVGCPRPAPSRPTPTGEIGARSPFMDPRLEGAAVRLDTPPPAISGGTLRVVDGWAIASDPDRDRIVVVDYAASRRVHAIATLPPGSEPGRVIVDGAGRAHAVLRGSGEIFSFDPETPASGERRAVCPMPRGIAWDAADDVLHVACRGGELVTLPSEGGPAIRSLKIEGGDLRDVVIDRDGQLMVTSFRSAELLQIDADGSIARRISPTTMIDPLSGSIDRETGEFTEARFHPAVAWRTISMPTGEIAMVHQRASDTELQTAPGAYYTSSLCNGSIVQSAITFVDGTVVSDAPNLANASLSVDIAASPDGQEVAVVNAGNQSGQSAVVVYPRSELAFGTTCTQSWETDEIPGIENAIAVEYAPSDAGAGAPGILLVQQREPSRLIVVDRATDARIAEIDLGGASVFDTGHAIFHGNASRGTACASCHPEGGEDGRTWLFAGMGPRRTPAMHGAVTETAPFHWDGDLADLRALSDTVFTGRMSGPSLTNPQVDALGGWLDELPAPVTAAADREAVTRGQSLFFGEAECASCHSGGMLTNNETVAVGTGQAFQVPSLVGVSLRLPVMHDGCALTLHDRFRPDCGGGDEHGRTSHLSEPQIDDLVAFLETL
ncbi:MAG: cytochrome-c peroxidase [Myxococcota bacterium]|nr:cytochrome-c peroxidase [Myxococcota bacterium]